MIIYSLVETPRHPNFSSLYDHLGFQHFAFNSMRKAIAQLKKTPPDYVVAEFLYGFANNYAGVNISNLDVFLYSLQKYAPDTKVIVMAGKTDKPYIPKLEALFKIFAVIDQPARASDIGNILTQQ